MNFILQNFNYPAIALEKVRDDIHHKNTNAAHITCVLQ